MTANQIAYQQMLNSRAQVNESIRHNLTTENLTQQELNRKERERRMNLGFGIASTAIQALSTVSKHMTETGKIVASILV